MVKKIVYITIVFILSFTSELLAYEKPKKITLGVPRNAKVLSALWLNDIYTEAFARMGIEFSLEKLPGNRSAVLASNGEIDGEIERVYSYLGISNNLIRISENTRIVKFSAYSSNNNIELDGWKSLKNENLSVGYRLGVKLPEKILPTIIDKNKIYAARSIALAMKNLEYRRIDVYIEINDFINEYKMSEEYKNLNIELYNVGVIEKVTAHAYLHEKHKELEPELSRILADMKREGLFKKYMDKYGLNFKW